MSSSISRKNRNVPTLRTVVLRGLLLCLLCGLASTQAFAQAFSFPGTTPVGQSTHPLPINVTVQHSGLLNSILVMGQGNVGVDFARANSGSCTVGVSYPAGQSCTVAVTFAPMYPGVRSGAIVLIAQDGTVLGTQFLAGTGSGAIATFVPGLMSTVAGQATWLYNGDGEPAIDASLFLPFGIAIDSAGNIFIADQANNRIRKVTASTGLISTIAGNGILGVSGDGGPATLANLSSPSSVAIDGAGNVYVCDSGNNAVRKIEPTTGIITTVAGTLAKLGYSGDGAQATAAKLNAPSGIAVDSLGNLFIADTANNAIRRVDAVTGVITTVAGTGNSGFSGNGGLAAAALLDAPWSMTPAPGGLLYIADQGNNQIRLVDATGHITTIAGTGGQSFSGDLGPASQATLNAPANVAIDVAGNLYISDSGNNRIRKVTYGTNVITTVAGLGNESMSGDGGPATAAGLYGPYTLALDGLGNLYFTDVFHNRVRKVTANAAVLDFLPMRIGRIAAAQSETLENDGNATLTVSLVQAVSESVIDVPTTSCVTSLALAPIGQCMIGAAFAPTNLGTPDIGTISLTSDAVNSPGTLQLSGNSLTQDPSTVSISAGANPVSAGTTVNFTVTVSSGGQVPTGLVTLTDGANVVGTANLGLGGVVVFPISTLTGGNHAIIASYAGDSNNTPGVSATLVESVHYITAPTQTILAASANHLTAGVPVTFTATVTLSNAGSGNGAVSGTVTFTDGTTIIGAGSISGGIATITVSTLSVGQHSIVAGYAGVPGFGASTSIPLLLTVQAASSSTALNSSANPSSGAAPVVLTASVTSNGTQPTGNVSFVDGSATLGTSVVSPTGTATLSISTLAVGAHNIVATYSGDAFTNSSVSSALQQTVNIASTRGTLTSSANPSSQGNPVLFTAVIASNGGVPAGTVTFFDGTVSLGSGTLSATGTATLTTPSLGLGPHTINVNYGGDAYHAATSASLSQTIVQATSTALASSASTAFAGTPVTWTAIASGHNNQTVTGTVQFLDGSAVLATIPVDITGTAIYTSSALAIGSHSMSAVYSGDASNGTSTSNPLLETIQIAPSTTSLLSSANPSFTSASVSFNATVSSNGVRPTGSVMFQDASTILGSAPLANGVATFATSSLTSGAHLITASYSGDANNSASVAAALSQQVVQQMNLTINSTANPAMFQSSVTITVTASGFQAAYPPTSSVTLTDGSVTVGTASLSALQTATFTLTAPALGQHTLQATYSGDTHNSVTTSLPFIESVILRPTTISLSTSATSLSSGQQVTFVSVVQGAGPQVPTGIVTFISGSTTLGSAALDPTGVAILSFMPQQATDTVVAEYSGDSLFASSASKPNTVVVGPTVEFTMSATPGAVSIPAGQHTTLQVAIVSAASFSDTISLGCAGLPASATCTFSPSQVKVSGGASPTVSVVIDTGNPLGAGASASLSSPHASTALSCILPGGLLALLLLRPRRFRKQFAGLAMLIALCAATALSGCASSLKIVDTPPGTYAFRIIGTGTTTGVTQSGSVSLTVTP